MTDLASKTDAERELARQFARTAHLLPGAAWVPDARRRAFAAFEQAGLPHRRIEEWKYTDLRTGLKEAFPPAACSSRKIDAATLATALGPELARLPAIRIVLVNGRYTTRMTPEGHEAGRDYHLSPLAGAIGEPGYEWVEAGFAPAAEAGADPVLALNTAFFSDGILLRIATGARLSLPVHIVSIIDADAPKAIATRNLIEVGDGATATIIESHVVIGAAGCQANAVTAISVGAGATAHHIKHLARGESALHLARGEVRIGAGGTYRGFELTLGGKLVRSESRVGFAGAEAKLDLSGLMLGRGRDHIDTTLLINHVHPGCESRELFKAVLDDQSRAVFQGKVVVAAEAQKTDGKQMAQALMLSEDAEFDSKPELEIYADDVACGHGSTSAELDPAMMFYLRSRGIPEADARAMLIESFAAEAIEKIEDEALREAFGAIAVSWLRHRAA